MKRILLLNFLTLVSFSIVSAQLFEEKFEDGTLPADWIIETLASDGGWNAGSVGSLSTNAFNIPTNGSMSVIATNDDACNCNKSNDLLVSPVIDLSSLSAGVLNFDLFYLDNEYQGNQESATVEVSTDGTNWQVAGQLEGKGEWQKVAIDLSAWLSSTTFQFRIRYNDSGGWLYGCAIDNVVIEEPPLLEAALFSLKQRDFGEVGTGQKISGIIYNSSITEITSVKMEFEVEDGTDVEETLDNISIPAFSFYEFELTSDWVPSVEGEFEVTVRLLDINGTPDISPANNIAFYSSFIYGEVIVPNKIEDFLAADAELEIISGASNSLNGPTDLDFFPIKGRNELWVINRRTENTGGNTLTIQDATDDEPSAFLSLTDGNAWHFMSLPTGIAFSDDNFNFANSPGVRDANHSGGTFTGPSLWSSDLDIYAQPSGGNGSHIDMLHGSPFSMGIAHEIDNVFWIYDDFNNDIVRYDFVDDHGPGNDDHSDAIVRRFRNIGIEAASRSIPNHMKVDKSTGWLYFVDSGKKRVMRLDINSANGMTGIPLINEPLAEHSNVSNFVVEEIINTGLEVPCGLEIFENYLMIGDYDNGDISVYDMDNDFEFLGTIATLEEGLTGITMGPDGNIWYTNMLTNTLSSASPGLASSTDQLINATKITIAPNPTVGNVNINIADQNLRNLNLGVTNATGQIVYELNNMNSTENLDLSELSNGVYFLNFRGENFSHTKKLIIAK